MGSDVLMELNKPQVIQVSTYEVHLLTGKMNFGTLMYYMDRFRIDYLALNLSVAEDIKTCSQLISRLKLEGCDVKIVCTGEVLSKKIAKDIGADGYTLNSSDIVKVMEAVDDKN